MAEFADKTHTDVSLWDALELREPMEGLSKGAHGYVIGWTGSAYELKINNRTYEVLPHQAKHKERPPLDGADEEIKKEFGTCPLCEDKTMTVADPYYACCGGQICERCADLLDLHRLSKRKLAACKTLANSANSLLGQPVVRPGPRADECDAREATTSRRACETIGQRDAYH